MCLGTVPGEARDVSVDLEQEDEAELVVGAQVGADEAVQHADDEAPHDGARE